MISEKGANMQGNDILSKLSDAIVKGEEDQAVKLTRGALELGIDAKKILTDGLIKGSEIVGDLFEKMEYYLPDLLISADAMVKAMELIKPKLKGDGPNKPLGIILIGSVEGDVHSIGKNLMIALLEGQGYEVTDLGTDVPSEKFVEEAKKLNPNIIGMSGLLTTSISAMQKTVLMLKEENIQSKIIIGGGLLTKESSEMVGADDFAVDGWEGLKKIKKILEGVE